MACWPGYYLLLSAASFLARHPVRGCRASRWASRGAAKPAIRFLLAWAGGLVAGGGSGADQAAALCAAGLSGAGDPGGAVRAGAAPRCSISAGADGTRWIGIGAIRDRRRPAGGGDHRWRRIYFGGGMPDWPCWRAAGAGRMPGAGGAGAGAARASRRWRVLLSLLAMLVFAPALTAGAGPRLEQLWITQRLKPLVDADSPARRSAAGAGRLSGAQPGLRAGRRCGADRRRRRGRCGRQVRRPGAGGRRRARRFPGAAGGIAGRRASRSAKCRGFNYSRGRKVHVTALPGRTRVH